MICCGTLWYAASTTVQYRRRSSPRLLSHLRQQQRPRSLRKLQPRVSGNSDSTRKDCRYQVPQRRRMFTGRSPVVPHLKCQDASKSTLICYRCGLAGHTSSRCKTRKNIVCHHCGKCGHMKRACKSQGKQNPPKQKGSTNTVRHIEDEEVEEREGVQSDSQTSPLFQVNSKGLPNAPPIKVKVKLDDCLVDIEVDTGASISMMSKSTFRQLWPGRHLEPSPIRFQTYLKEPIPVVDCCYVHVEYMSQCCEGPFVVLSGSGPHDHQVFQGRPLQSYLHSPCGSHWLLHWAMHRFFKSRSRHSLSLSRSILLPVSFSSKLGLTAVIRHLLWVKGMSASESCQYSSHNLCIGAATDAAAAALPDWLIQAAEWYIHSSKKVLLLIPVVLSQK